MPVSTPEHESLLEQIRLAHHARVNARAAAEKEARDLIRNRIHDAAVLESRAVRTAMAGGVSRRRAGIEGLGTSDYHTMTRVLAMTEPEVHDAELKQNGDGRVRLVDAAERAEIVPAYGQARPAAAVPVARVDWREYATLDGVHDLAGYVHKPEGRDYWVGLTDDNEEPSDGVLWFEARQSEGALPDRLRALLNEL